MASGQGGFLCSCVSYAKGTGIMDSLGLRLHLFGCCCHGSVYIARGSVFCCVLLYWLLLSHFSRVRLCDPIDGSPPGSPVPGILQARTLEWVAISFSNAWKWSHPVVSNPQRPHGLQPTRLLHPWDFPGKSTGVGCHCFLRLYNTPVFRCPEIIADIFHKFCLGNPSDVKIFLKKSASIRNLTSK